MDGDFDVSEYDLFTSVINDVISNVQNVFIEDGKDESVLQVLKELWEDKFLKSKAVDKHTNCAPPVQKTTIAPQNFRMPNSSRPQSPLIFNRAPLTNSKIIVHKNMIPTMPRPKPPEQMIIVRSTANPPVPSYGGQVPQAIGQQILFRTQPGLLPQVVAANQSGVVNIPQVVRPLQILSQGLGQTHPTRLVLGSPRIIQLQQPQQRLQTNALVMPRVGQVRPISNLLNIRFAPRVNSQIVVTRTPVQPLVGALPGANNLVQVRNIAANQITIQGLAAAAAANRTNLVNPRLTISQPQRLRQVDGTPFTEVMNDDDDDDVDDEEIAEQSQMSDNEIDLKVEEEEEEESYPLDDINAITVADIEDILDCDNLLLCLYDKIHSSKGKFKLFLKFGVLCVGGKERVFKGAIGSFE